MSDSITFGIIREGARVAIVGDLRTVNDRDSLKEFIAAAVQDPAVTTPCEIVLDVSHAGYFDSAALACLVIIARKCAEAGCTLAIENASPELLEQLRQAHIDQLLVGRGGRITPAGA